MYHFHTWPVCTKNKFLHFDIVEHIVKWFYIFQAFQTRSRISIHSDCADCSRYLIFLEAIGSFRTTSVYCNAGERLQEPGRDVMTAMVQHCLSGKKPLEKQTWTRNASCQMRLLTTESWITHSQRELHIIIYHPIYPPSPLGSVALVSPIPHASVWVCARVNEFLCACVIVIAVLHVSVCLKW